MSGQNSPSLPKFEVPLVVNRQTNKNWYFFFQSLTSQLLTSVGLASTDLEVDGSPLTSSGTITANLKTQSGIAPGTYAAASLTVNSKGIITGIGSGQTFGSVSSVGLTSSGSTIAITGTENPIVDTGSFNIDLPAQSGVTAGAYTNINATVNAEGIITAVANGSAGGSITVGDGTHTETAITTITFTSGATVSSGGTGIADVAISGGGGSLTLTDGTHTVSGTTQITVSGATVGGTTPNATLTISGGGSTEPYNVTPDTHPVTPAFDVTDEFEYGSALDTTGARFSGAAAWTIYNAQSVTNSVGLGALALQGTTAGVNDAAVYGMPITTPSSPFSFVLKRLSAPGTNLYSGLFLGFHATGKGYYFGFYPAGPDIYVLTYNTFAGAGLAVAATFSTAYPSLTQAFYFRTLYDGTNVNFACSPDGASYYTGLSVPYSTFLGSAPDTIGIHFANTANIAGWSSQVGYDFLRETA